jgi:Spy/CpxP family protein refolding chaperone
MKRKLIALTTAFVVSLGTVAIVNAEEPASPEKHRHRERGRRHGNPLEKLSENLNLSADQKVKVQPIIDQAKPQIRAIHEEAMRKTKAVMDNTMAQIRPLLTPQQQQQLDAKQKAHEDMRNANKEMEEAPGE